MVYMYRFGARLKPLQGVFVMYLRYSVCISMYLLCICSACIPNVLHMYQPISVYLKHVLMQLQYYKCNTCIRFVFGRIWITLRNTRKYISNTYLNTVFRVWVQTDRTDSTKYMQNTHQIHLNTVFTWTLYRIQYQIHCNTLVIHFKYGIGQKTAPNWIENTHLPGVPSDGVGVSTG